MYLRSSYISLSLIIGGIFILPFPSSAISFDTFVQKLSQIQRSHRLEASGTEEAGQDIFLQSLANFDASKAGAVLESIKEITTTLQEGASINNRNCFVDDADITRILYQNPDIRPILYDVSNTPLSATIATNKNILNACERVFMCSGGPKNITDSSRELAACENVVSQQFLIDQKFKENFSNMRSINRNDNIYIDKIKENGLFDIMLDIENIEKILFDQNDGGFDTIEMIYYALPPHITSPPPSGNGASGGGGNNSGGGGGGANGGGFSSNNNQGMGGNTTPPGEFFAIQNSEWGGSSYGGNEILGEINNFLFENSPQNPTQLPQQGEGFGETTIAQTICLPSENEEQNNTQEENNEGNSGSSMSSSTQIQNGDLPGNGSENPIDQLGSIEEEIITILDGYLESPGVIPGQNTIQFENPGPLEPSASCVAECSDKSGVDRLACEGSCCISSCSDISDATEKAICMSQCICGETSSQNDILRMRICRVPAKPSIVKAGKTIHSVEEAVNEINMIFLELKNNGALIKRNKKSQFLDSSFSDIKLKDILAFDIFIATKPIYDVLQIKEIQKDIDDSYEESKLINNTSGERSRGKDKNKYISFSDEKYALKRCEEKDGIYDKNTKDCIIKEKDQEKKNKKENYNLGLYNMNDNLSQFLLQHAQVWVEISRQFSEFKGTAKNLRDKADIAQ